MKLRKLRVIRIGFCQLDDIPVAIIMCVDFSAPWDKTLRTIFSVYFVENMALSLQLCEIGTLKVSCFRRKAWSDVVITHRGHLEYDSCST